MRLLSSLAAASLVSVVTSIARAQSPAPLPPLPEPTTPKVNIDTGEAAPAPAPKPKPAPAPPSTAAAPDATSPAAPPPAAAPPDADAAADKPRFGKAGTAVVSSDMQLSAQYVSTSQENGAGGDSTTTVVLQPAFDYFVGDNISVGGDVSFAVVTNSPASGDSKTVTGVGAGFRVGAYLGDGNWGVWPKIGIGFATASSDNVTESSSSFDAYAPIVYTGLTHFLVGLGPNADVQLSNSTSGTGTGNTDLPKQTRVGAAFLVGGWW